MNFVCLYIVSVCVAGAVHEAGAASQCGSVVRGDRHADQAIPNSRARRWRGPLRLHHAPRQRPQRRGIVAWLLLFYYAIGLLLPRGYRIQV